MSGQSPMKLENRKSYESLSPLVIQEDILQKENREAQVYQSDVGMSFDAESMAQSRRKQQKVGSLKQIQENYFDIDNL